MNVLKTHFDLQIKGTRLKEVQPKYHPFGGGGFTQDGQVELVVI